ncbi:MAG: YfhO family protein, partial [Acidimicrobiales bacterium]
MLLATERLIRRPDALSAAGLAVVVALQWLGGHPESSFHALFATVAFFVLRVFQLSRKSRASSLATLERGASRITVLGRALRRPLLAFAVALVVGSALVAIVLVPFAELLRNSSDLTARPRGGVYVAPKYFLAAFMPSYFPGTFDVAIAFYVGALPLMLGLFALLRVRLERIAIAVFGALCIAVVLGIQPFFGIVRRLPGFDVTYNSRLTILYVLCVALLAGWGLDDLVQRLPGRRSARGSAVLAGGLLVLPIVLVFATRGSSVRFFGHALGIAWKLVQPTKPTTVNILPMTYRASLPVIHLASLIVWIVVAGAAASLLYARVRRGFAAGPFAALAILLVVVDVFQAGVGKNPAIADSHAEQPVTQAIRYLEQQRPSRYVAVSPSVGVNPLPPDVNLRYGIYDARGYDLPVVTRFGRLWTRYISPPNILLPLDTPAVPTSDLDQTSLRILSLLGVTDLLQQKGQPPLQLSGLQIAYRGSDATIYANDDALPRTWLVADQQVVEGDGRQLAQIASSRFDPRQVLITQTKLPGLAQAHPNGPAPGEAHLTRYGAEQVTIEAHADRTSELVLSDVYYPGWHATVDGHPVRIDRVDYLLRGVPVPPGTHRVEFSYDPTSFRIGWLVSLMSVLTVTGMTVVGVRRRRRGSLVRSHARTGS